MEDKNSDLHDSSGLPAMLVASQGEVASAYLPGALLHYCILLTGFGTVFLGPLLPTLTGLFHLSDRGAGTLLAAQFVGAFAGGATTSAPLRTSMLRGLVAAVAGFAALAVVCGKAPQLLWAVPALAVLGFGIGQTLTSVNLLASEKWSARRGAALTLLNFTWSFGALTAPLLLLRVVRSVPVSTVLAGFAVLLLLGLAATILRRPVPLRETSAAGAEASGLPRPNYLFFCFLLFLYGGVETSLGGWLTTFDHRYGGANWQGMATSTTAFWASLTIARLLAPAVLRRVSERLLLRGSLCTAVAAVLLMLTAQGTAAISLSAALAGLSLSPWFPLVLSALVGQRPTAPQAGRVIAVSGLGAAALPWLVGQVSAASGSLRIALLLPALGIGGLLALSFSGRMSADVPVSEQDRKSV